VTTTAHAHPAAPGVRSRRRYTQSVLTALPGGLIGAVLGFLLAAHALGFSRDGVVLSAMAGWSIGFLAGVGAFHYPLSWLSGRPTPGHDHDLELAGLNGGVWRYFRWTTDHKVVGVQYLVLGMVLFGAGGLGAMLIRLELMRPGARIFPPQTYTAIIGMHGFIMIIGTIVMIAGPFTNFVMPIMIGARDMAFPRLNALSFWLLATAAGVFLSAPFLGGFPTGWTAYAPLSVQAPYGMDAYIVTVLLFVMSSAVASVNVIVTIITMRAPGMNWSRLPIFTWGSMATAALGLVAMPSFMAAQILVASDRALHTNFYVGAGGGSDWLYEHLFWFMGHPEVYVIALPAFAVVLELAPVFARKPLFGYRTAVGGIVGVTALSVLVWAHHMFLTGWSGAAAGPFMLTTEMISIPTGLVFLGLVGTLWRGRIWVTVPTLFVLSFLWNFVIGGVTGLFLADVPTDVQLHGSMFVTAHFHYTLMGGAMMGFFAAVYYWFPKMTGRMYDERLGRFHFWATQIGFNVTFMAMFCVGLQGMPRRVADYAPKFATGNFVASIGAFVLGIAMLVFLYNMVRSVRRGELCGANPWRAKTLEWQVPTPVPLENFEEIPLVTAGPYEYGEPQPVPAIAAEARQPVNQEAG